jgi:fatty-acyl-CoA synthase
MERYFTWRRGVNQNEDVDLNLWRIFEHIVHERPCKIATLDAERSVTYGELAERALRLASVLQGNALGLRRPRADLAPWEAGQDLIAVDLLNGPEFLEVLLGSFAARCAAFNVNYRYVARELRYLLDDARTRTVVFHERFAPVVAEAVTARPGQHLLLQVADGSGHALVPGALDYEAALSATQPAQLSGHDPDDLYVAYTGGTTGHPKATLWRQGDIWMSAFGGSQVPELDETGLALRAARSDGLRVMPNAPLMHSAAQWMALAALLSGGSVVWNSIRDRFDADDLWRTVQRTDTQRTLLIGETMSRPAVDALVAGNYTVPSLRTILVGGAATTTETKRRLLRALPETTIIDVAGSTETGGGLSNASSRDRVDEVGLFWPRPTSGVLDATLTRRLSPGESDVGWFATSGHIPLGYLNDPKKTEATFVTVAGSRWAVPGDRAELRGDGLVKLRGREAATINSGGEKIFAEEVEQVLLDHPQVRDALVVGRPSERWGQEVVALVQPQDESLTEAALRDWSARTLARYKLPKEYILVTAIRRSAAGKPDYAWASNLVCQR